MKAGYLNLCLIATMFLFCTIGCEKNNDLRYDQLLKSKTWTQKTGYYDGINYGSVQTFYQISFGNDGYSSIIWNPWQGGEPPQIQPDTLETTYQFENNSILFPEAFAEININFGDSSTVHQAFVNDYEIVSFSENLFHLKRILKTGDSIACFGPIEMYLEPI
jgi:hypothetical protein